MTIIRDINGNRLKKSLRHFTGHAEAIGHYHIDSTGLWVVDYYDEDGEAFCAFIRPENAPERTACRVAKAMGTPRP